MTFPALVPSSRVFTPGDYPNTALAGWSGQENRTRNSNVLLSSALRVSFLAINETQLGQIIDHYNSRLGTYLPFDVPSAVWSGVSDYTDYTLTGYSWRYAGPPLIEDLPCGIYNVELDLQSVVPQNASTSRRTWTARITWATGAAIGLAAGAALAQGVEWFAVVEWSEQDTDADAFGEDYEATATWAPGTALEVVSNFDVALYTGNGSTNTITGLDFEPGLVWIKRRNVSTGDHVLFDFARGATKYWTIPTLGSAEITNANTVTSFDSNGFALGSSAVVNANGSDYVAWCWQKGASVATNTDGTITSDVWLDSAAKFSIFKYTGTGVAATVGHGLGVNPDFVIIKTITVSNIAAHAGGSVIGNNAHLTMVSNTAINSSSGSYSTHDATTVGVKASNSNTNQSAAVYIGYAFANVAGIRKFGKYTGQGATATAVTTDFEPRFVIIKSQSATTNWMYFDNDRGVTNQLLHTTAAETTVDKITFSSTGFAVKANEDTNTNGQTFFYAAFS